MNIEQETEYLINLDEKTNNLVFVLKAKENEPVTPVVLYDGQEHAVLQRTPDTIFILDYLPAKARPFLLNSNLVGITEMNPSDKTVVTQIYTAPVVIVPTLPFDAKDILSKEQMAEIIRQLKPIRRNAL